MIKYRDYTKFSNNPFRNSFNENLSDNTELDYNSFEEIDLNALSFSAPLIKRIVRANQRIFINTEKTKL